MYCVNLPQFMNQIISSFYRLGLWHREEEPTVQETILKIVYSIYYLLFPVSLFAGAVKNDNQDESIFLAEMSIIASVMFLKLFYIIWKKKQILELLNRIGVYSIKDREEFTFVDDKIKRFTKYANFLLVPSYIGGLVGALVVPFLGREKKLFFDIGFPLDWKNNEDAFWIAFIFVSIQLSLSAITLLFSVITWYLMMGCVLKYVMLGNQISKMGEREITKLENANTFLGHLIETIQFNNRIREYLCLTSDEIYIFFTYFIITSEIQQMESFLSLVFFTQVATSGLCICGSIYSLIFSVSENLIEYMINICSLFYNLFEIFMVMYFGNEIKLSSDRLTYCLFESDWLDKRQSTKKLIIFGEILKRPYVLVVAKLYPLTLETFTKILKSTYSMFNILKGLK